MSNKSKKYRNKKIQTGVIIALVVILIGSFIISKKNSRIDPEVIAAVEVTAPQAHIKGNPESDLLLIEYSDFQCPACKNAAPQLSYLIENFGDKFALEYRHLPLYQLHPNAEEAAQAAEAAGMQGKFWEMHDMLFENQSEWSHSFRPMRMFRSYAEEIGINPDRLEYDMASEEIQSIIDTHVQEAKDLDVRGTPTLILNGEAIKITDFMNQYLSEEIAELAVSEEESELESVE